MAKWTAQVEVLLDMSLLLPASFRFLYATTNLVVPHYGLLSHSMHLLICLSMHYMHVECVLGMQWLNALHVHAYTATQGLQLFANAHHACVNTH